MLGLVVSVIVLVLQEGEEKRGQGGRDGVRREERDRREKPRGGGRRTI